MIFASTSCSMTRLLENPALTSGDIYATIIDPILGFGSASMEDPDQFFGTSMLMVSFSKSTVFSVISHDSL